MTAVDHHDVVVVGARIAGAPLAAHLARAGLSVAVVDRARFPSDTASTHFFQASAVASLGRLGVIDRLLATGAPWLEIADMRLGDFTAQVPWPTQPGDPGPGLCVRRTVLDAILVDAAREAGATVHTGTRVTGLVEAGGRVAGVVADSEGRERRLLAPLVVGADGRSSKIARLVEARAYNVSPNERFGFWGYYENATWSAPAVVHMLRWEREFVVACPTDSGLYMVAMLLPLEDMAAFTPDVEGSFDARVASYDRLAEALDGARRVFRPRGISAFSGFFRESAGPGWVLTGDAGHFKDPSPGQGISDALRQGERLAEVVIGAGGVAAATDKELAAWWRWRDRDAREMHWFARDLGGGGPVPAVFSEVLRGLSREPDGMRRSLDVFNHRERPSKLLTPARLLGAAGRLIASGQHRPGAVLNEVKDVVTEEVRRRWRNHFPAYAPEAPVPEADPAAVAAGS